MAAHRESVSASDAPAAIGPYVQAIRTGNLLFCSGQIGLDPRTGELAGRNAADQAGRCLENLAAVCAAAGTSLDRALRLTIYTTDLAAFAAINESYADFFASQLPARAAVGVAALPKGATVEIDAIVAAP